MAAAQGVPLTEYIIIYIGIATLAVASVACVVAYIALKSSRRVEEYSQEQLKLVRQLSQLHPKLVVSLENTSLEATALQGEADIIFLIKNKGRLAATKVACKFQFDVEHLEPETHSDFHRPSIGPEATYRHRCRVLLRSSGLTEIRCICTCDEVGETEQICNLEVPEIR